ncbi:MAG: DUF3488 and transglutaminase-like domain-containing protein [Pedobacter sp.]|nr:DUF3488 and transglutaminase-like domain-containing protein [Pedobacter sp.]
MSAVTSNSPNKSTIRPAARYWQLAALITVVLPQVDRLPPWLLAAVFLGSLWASPWAERRKLLPGKFLRAILLLAGMAGVYASHRTLVGAEGGVSFLILCAVLKVLESRDGRDLFISVVLDFFILATAFLFSQSLVTALYVGLANIVIVAALLVLQQREGVSLQHTLRRAAAITMQAVPLLLVLFVFMPRLPPIWSLNLNQGSGKTGMSDSMSPGDIASLSESSELAFRVEFQGPRPPGNELYWRGLVLTQFDGQRWTEDPRVDGLNTPMGQEGSWPDWVFMHRDDQSFYRYRIIQEATDQRWLFSLAIPHTSSRDALFTRDARLTARIPVFSQLTYEVQSWTAARMDVYELLPWMRSQALQLPASGNPRAREMASRWHNSSANESAYIRRVLAWLHEEEFFYTLQPPRLGEDRIDDFLFRTRRGFCEHYASSFVFLMRAAGIPARVVVGYQGGEQSPLGDYWLVRQMDAHAWAEVWLVGEGWVRIDPTASVAPDRIEHGAARMADNREYWGDSGLSGVRYGNYQLFRQLRSMADYVNYRWTRDVLGYNSESQDGLMQRLLGDTSLLRRLGVMLALMTVLTGLILFWALRGERREQHPLDKLYRRYCQRLAKEGVLREAGEGPQAFARRVARELPRRAEEAEEFARLYTALRYRPAGSRDKLLEQRLRRLARGRIPGIS